MNDQPPRNEAPGVPFDVEPASPAPVEHLPEAKPRPVKTKRPWKWRLLEFALWALLSIVTAVVLTLMSDELLPTNF